MAYDLQLSHIGKVYDNGTPAVIDFNLDVDKGEFIAFLGPSGCGKTTTLRMIAGFETITSGDLLIRGKRVNDLCARIFASGLMSKAWLPLRLTVRLTALLKSWA